MGSSISRTLIAAIGLLSASTTLLAQEGCKAYPFRDGVNIDQLAQNKLFSTASASVSFDDIDAVKDARDEATMDAKAALAHFMTETIQGDQNVKHIVEESKTMSGASKENVRNETIKRIKQLRSHTEALLRGVVTLGDCYTPGSEVRVTVGWKPETLQAAEGLAGAIGSSVSNQPTPSARHVAGSSNASNGNSGTKQPLTKVEAVSNTEDIKKF